VTRAIQCDNCGAVVLEEELVCGECGAPRPSVIAPHQLIEEPETDAPQEPISALRTGAVRRVVAILLASAGALLCLLGLAAFVILGLGEREGVPPPENWLYSAICCLLPLAGAGTTVALAALALWWTRLRKR
jgi:hypothetical protein